jgi:tRNA threonylcarbamoyladenosine biosynthesis protein TsaE
MPVFHTTSEDETAALAAQLAAGAAKGDVFTLQGVLGAGKSVFARGFIRSLAGQNTEVPSPTFTLIQTYDTAKGSIWHFDLYRLKDPEEIYETGWEEALADGITLVEWPQRLGNLLPPHAKTIEITIDNDSRRTIRISE